MPSRPARLQPWTASPGLEASQPTPLKVGMLVASTAAADGGISELIREMSRTMHHPPAVAVEVFTLERGGDTDAGGWNGIPINRAKTLGPRSFGYSADLGAALRQSHVDLLHVHGLWMYPSIAARRWHLRTRRPYVISPQGMLDPWALANKSWKKRLAMRLYEDAHLQSASCLHAVSESEVESIRALGYKAPICVIANGVNPPPTGLPPPAWRKKIPAGDRVLLYLGRVTPKKGPSQLIRAWSALQDNGPAARPWHLVFVGPGPEPYLQELRSIAVQSGVEYSVHFAGPAYGADKAASFGASDAFVLPSFSEGMPLAALEAWSHGLPALLTPQCNLPEGFTRGAAVASEPEVGSLVDGLRQLTMMTDEQRLAMGQKGLQLVNDRFSWIAATKQLEQVYRWMLGQQAQPDTIRLA